MLSTSAKPQKAFLGKILSVRDEASPLESGDKLCTYIEDGCLMVGADGRLLSVGQRPASFDKSLVVYDYRPALLLPGFIDSHIHFSQLDMIGCYAGELLDWLTRFTFPHEAELAGNQPKLKESARTFVDQLLAHGITMACIYGPSKAGPTEVLLEELASRGMRAIVGKTSMDRNAPSSLLDPLASDLAHSEHLIKTWHNYKNEGRLYYALTPRFAPSCSDPLMRGLAELKTAFPDLYVQTHYAENLDELAWIRQLYPQHKDYLAVYESFGLIDQRSLLGHGIHLSQREHEALAESQAILCHCPSSNLFLGSGLFAAKALRSASVPIALGSDVGAGTSISMWRTMGEAYKVAKIRGEDWPPTQLFYTATLGAARALGLDTRIGSLSPGKDADFQVINIKRSVLLARRLADIQDIEQLVFALIHHCDDRNVEAVYIAGKQCASFDYKA